MSSFCRAAIFRGVLALVTVTHCLDVKGQAIERMRESAAAPETKKAAVFPAEFSGKWIYRSFISTPSLSDETKPLDRLLFGQGNLKIDVDSSGKVTGTLGGDGWELKLAGSVSSGSPQAIQFQGTGKIGGEKWVYDYIGYPVPKWPNGIDQRPAIIGTIVRTVPHSGGKAQAGYVAQWIAVHQIDEEEVRELENGWAAAVEKNDPDKINRFFADYFSFVDPNQNLQTREQHLDDFRTGKLKVTSMRIRNVVLEFKGPAVRATVRASVEATYDGHNIAGDYDFADDWLVIQGRLRAVVRKQVRVEADASMSDAMVPRRATSSALVQDTLLHKPSVNHTSVASLNSAITGKTSVLLFVKGSFCPQCMSQVSTMSEQLAGRNANVFVISASGEDDLKDFPKAAYRLVADPKLEAFKAYGAFKGEAKHATIVLDAKGKEIFRDVDNEPLFDTSPVIRAIETSNNSSNDRRK